MKRKYESLTLTQQRIIMISFIALFVLVMFVVSYYVGRPLIEYAREPEKFKEWIDSYGLLGRLIYILITTLQVIVAVIPGEPFEIAGGYCFGLVEGTLLCLTGITLGSVIIFMFVRKFGHYFVEIFIKKETMEKMKFLQNPKKLNALTFLIFAIPGTPKDLLTYTVGLTDMDIKTWAIISFIARVPSVITSTYAGASIGQKEYLKTGIIFGVTLVISFIGVLIYNKYSAEKD
ncbi:MAG: TVP38/TMEM64 family protein [Erysipelotrichaceae bacterium]|nr:TVP38/TMEM64 family protein [Erysipelotrichaceae bacterium]